MQINRCILILGPTAPSIGGITTAVNALMTSRLASEFDMRLLANSNHREMNRKGIIDLHNIASSLMILGRLLKAIYFFRPSIVQVETAGGIGFLKQSMYIFAARMMRCKVIVSLHCANEGEPLMEFADGNWIARFYCERVLQMCSIVKLLSPLWKGEFAIRWGLDCERVIGLRNCLDDSFPWGKALTHSRISDKLRVICVGSVGKRKGSFLLIAAIERLNASGIPASLVLVGPEEISGWMAHLADAALKAGVQGEVTLRGGISRERALLELCEADVFALPSYAEGMPYSIIEAMAIGLPVVASDVGAIRDLIANEDTGLLVEAGSVDQLTNALARLARDMEFRRKLALRGNLFVSNEFSARHLEVVLRPVYEGLIGA